MAIKDTISKKIYKAYIELWAKWKQ
jgi:hypothetical protein